MKIFCRLVSSSPFSLLISRISPVSMLLAATLFSTAPQTLFAAEFTVCPSGCDYTSPELAVNSGALNNGDTVNVTSGTYVLSDTIQVANSITILGNDSVFDANGLRAISVSGAGTNVSLTNVTIRNGQADITTGGGAIWISGGAIVNVVNVVFTDNQAEFGGAVYNAGSTFQANAAIFTGNQATAGNGGALLTDGLGTSYLSQSIIDGNAATLAGGGVAVEGNDPQDVNNRSTVTLNNTTVSNNAALTSSLIIDNFNDPLLTPSTNCGIGPYGQTFLAGAEAISAFQYRVRVAGGGIATELAVPGRLRKDGPTGPLLANATATIPAGLITGDTPTLVFLLDQPVALDPLATYAIETEIVGNYSVITTSPGTYPDGQAYSCSTILNSTDYDFRILGGTPGEGGGVHSSLGGHAGLANSTVSGNVGDGVFATKGGIVSTWFNTITNNSGNGATAVPVGPGVTEAGLVFITATILAGNGGDDCNGDMVTSGYNLVGDGSNCVLGPVANDNDIIGSPLAQVDPLLGPLQYNGGANETHAIDESSPAFNAAGPDLAGLPCHDFPTDQRGVSRPRGPACDIGAFEVTIPVGPLQSLIDAAGTGATIIVPDGTYTEQINIGDGKILQATTPYGVTIDATGYGGPAITATGGDFTLEGIHVTGGSTDSNGGGITANVNGTNITLTDVLFDFNAATLDGGAIYLLDGTITGTNVTFSNNSAGGNGGAILGGASSSINLDAAQFDSNSAGASGGAIFNEGDLTLANSTINGSNAGIGGGIFNAGGASLNITGSTISNNDATGAAVTAGGAIAGAGEIEIRNSTLSGNTATAGNGGGIGLTGGSAVLNNATLAYNAASASGGAFYAEIGALISFSNSLFSDNNGGAPNCNSVQSLGFNLFQNAPCPTAAGDIVSEPLIGLLAANGGPTATHALQPTSPAIDNGSPVPSFPQFDGSNFQLLQTQGAAALDGNTLFLTGGAQPMGAAFVSNPIDPAQDFSATFQFLITPGPGGAADGITFTIADSTTVPGGSGGLLGIAVYDGQGGATSDLNGVSVEFDTWVNGAAEGANDPGSVDHIGIDINGNLSSQDIAVLGANGTLSDGNVWTAWIDYDATAHILEIRAANDGIRPAAPTLSGSVDILSLTGPTAYVGFTAGAGFVSVAGFHRILSFSFSNSCETTDQRGDPRPLGSGCDIGAYEGLPVPLVLGPVDLRTYTIGQDLNNGTSYPGVTDVPIIDIPIEKLTGNTFNAPASAPLGSFPLGSFPLGSFDLRASPLGSFPLGSFPLGSFPLGSFPLGSFPLSSLPLLTLGGWNEILNDIPALAGAPLQTVTLEKLMTLNPLPDSVASIQLQDLAIEGSPLASLSLSGLSLGETTVAEIDQWAQSADPAGAGSICSTLSAADPGFSDCSDTDTLLGLEVKGAPVSALSLSSLPLGSFPVGSFPIGSFPIGSFPLGSFPLGSFPLGSFPIGSFPLGSFPLGSFPIGSFPLGSFNLLAAPLGSFPLGSFPIGSFPLGSFDIDGKSFCEFYDEKAIAGGDATCAALGINPGTDSLADLVAALQTQAAAVGDTTSTIGSTPLGSFPLGSFPIGSFPLGSFDLDTLSAPPISELTLAGIGGCTVIAVNSSDTCSSLGLNDNSTLADAASAYGGTLAASPLGSFPIGSFDVANLPLGSFPLGSFEINGAPLGSFPLGSFDLIGSPLGSFPLGSFPLGSFQAIIDESAGDCSACQTLADAARAGVIKRSAALNDLAPVPAFATTTLGEVLDALTLATLYCPPDPDPTAGPEVGCAETLGQIRDPGNLTLGQLLIAMMLKTDFPWETIPLDRLDAQAFSADNFVNYQVRVPLTGSGSSPISIAVTLDEGFMYVKGSASLITSTQQEIFYSNAISDPVIFSDGNGTQTLTFDTVLAGYTSNALIFTAVPPLALGNYPASAAVTLGSDDPVDAEASNASLAVIPDPVSDISDPLLAVDVPRDVLTLGFISTPDDNDFFQVAPPAAGDRVSVFMSNPAGDNDLIMYEPLSTVEAKGQLAESTPLDSVPFEDDGVDYRGNVSEEPNALEDVNLFNSPLASISTNRGGLDESVSAIAGDDAPFTIQVSGYNGAVSDQPYTLRVKVTPQVQSPQCTARNWPSEVSTVTPAGAWMTDTNAVFLVNGNRLASSDPGGAAAADAALNAINNLIHAPGITNGVVVDVSGIFGVDNAYATWDANPCDVDAPNAIVNAITGYIEEMRAISPNLAYVTIVGSDEVIPFARKPDETSISNESTFAGEFDDNALYGALLTRHFLSDDSYGDIDPIPWLDRYLNVPELGVGRLVESALDIQAAAENYIAFGGVLDPQTALSAGYDFVADAAEDIDDTFNEYAPALGLIVEPALIDPPGVNPANAWTRSDFLNATGVTSVDPVDQVSFNMHFDFDEALPSSGDANGNYTDNLISTADFAGINLLGGIWFTVGCHSGTNVPDVSVVAGAPSEDWAQTFSRLGALYLAQNAFGLGDTEALALTERLMSKFARNLNGRLTIGQAHAFAKQQYFADLGLYGEYDYKALQAATLFGLPMYRYGSGAAIPDPSPPPLPVTADPISGLSSANWSLTDTGITRTTNTSKGDVFNVDGEVQFVHFRPLQPIVRRDVTSPDGARASGAFLTGLVTEDLAVADIAFARPVIDLGENEPEIESDEVVFPTAFTNIANFKAPPPGGGPFEPRDQLNVIVGQFTSPLDGDSTGTERLFRSFGAQVFYRPGSAASLAPSTTVAGAGDFVRPEFDNVQASIVGSTGARQAAFSIDVSDEGTVLRVAVLYLRSVTDGKGNWSLVDLVKGAGNTWTGGGPVEESAIASGQVDYMAQAVDDNGNVANSTFKGLFYVADALPVAPEPGGGPGSIGVVLTVIEGGEEVPVDPGDWITTRPVDVTITDTDPEKAYEYSVDYKAFQPLTSAGFQIDGDGVHIVTVRETDGSNPVTFVILIDTTPPQVVITVPSAGEFIVQGEAPDAEYDCLDAGSGITSCAGPVPDGTQTPSAAEGAQSFLVTAQDDAENGPVTAENIYYVVKPLEAAGPVNPAPVTDPVPIDISATDLAEFDETVTIDWGDGSPLQTLDMTGASVSAISANHLYSVANVYKVTVTVDYEGQFTQTEVVDFVVVYDAKGGFVTGGGWFDSPAGAYTPNDSSDLDVTGKAQFGFVSKYKKGQSAPDGSTNFRFAAGNLKFESTSYDWMIISGARARFKGTGKVNGGGEPYKFQITALDADVSGSGITQDGFRIRIWQEGAGVLYDNGLGADDGSGNGGTTPLGGGSITIHQPK